MSMPKSATGFFPDRKRKEAMTVKERRLFLKGMLLAAWAGLVAAAGLGMGAVLRLVGGGVSRAATPPVPLGKAQGLQPGQVRIRGRVALVRDQGGLMALELVCPHLGCRPKWEGKQFLCPCHGSRFARDGSLLSGPARKGLRHLRLERSPDGTLVAYPDQPVKPGLRLAPTPRG